MHNNIYGKTFSKIKKKKARDLTFKLVVSQYKIKVQGREWHVHGIKDIMKCMWLGFS